MAMIAWCQDVFTQQTPLCINGRTKHWTKLHGGIISPLPGNQLMDTRTHTIFIQYDGFYITGEG
uniref:Uncharacterized protein n=1 Tax=Glossina pallidipes TaxID=7398 RepID=A0A1A9ZMQ9_GLOPL